jgi:hypothetical protein
MNNAIKFLAQLLYRKGEPHRVYLIMRGVIVNILAFAAVVSGVFLLWSKFQDHQHQPSIELEASRWSVIFDRTDNECWNTELKSHCLASPMNQELWTSSLHRWDPQYFKTLNSNLRTPFWMGLQISPSELKKAQADGATRLMLGLVFARYEVWVDGVRMQVGDYMENDLPIGVDLSQERMLDPKPLSIAIAVFRDGKMRTVDSQWIVPKMGLFTSRASDQQMRWQVFEGDTRFLILFSVFLLFGLVFRFASSADEAKAEFRAASIFSLVLACSQFIMADSVFRLIGPRYYYPLFSAILILEFLATVGLGAAISRGRVEFISAVNALMAPALLLTLFLIPRELHDGSVTQWILQFVTPLGYTLAGAMCMIQFLHLQKQTGSNGASPQRNILLVVMTFIFIGLALAFIAESGEGLAIETHWARALIVFPLFILAANLAADVRENFRLVETTPVSAYHKLSPLPEQIAGILVHLDLKGSEQLFRAGAQQQVGGTIVSTIISLVWGQFVSSGGTILESSGDDLFVLFPEAKLKEAPTLWFKTLRAVHEDLQVMAQQLADNQVELSALKSIEFRASVCRGSVRPIWRSVGKAQIPSWVEAGTSNVFVDSARLLEIERDWSKENPSEVARTAVIIQDGLERDLQVHEGVSAIPVIGLAKHDKKYNAFILQIESRNKPELRMIS